jgi:uncharacterized protein YutE (UPF0331/DUF86 family)
VTPITLLHLTDLHFGWDQDAAKIAERQLVLDGLADHIATLHADWRRPRDERDALLLLTERAIIEPELADRLLKAKGFRNVLVHEYVELDPDLLYAHLRDDVGDLWEFARGVAGWLQAQ